MEPIGKKYNNSCTSSSNSVVWQGKDLPCVNIRKGDTVSDVVYNLATRLCELIDEFDLSNYDLDNLVEGKCGPKDFHDLIQLIIDNTGTSSETKVITEKTSVDIATCFQYEDPEGNVVKKLPLDSYTRAIGNKVCSMDNRMSVVNNDIKNINNKITDLEKKDYTFEIPEVVDINGNNEDITKAFEELEEDYLGFKSAVGLTDIYGMQDMSQADQTGNFSKKYGESVGWIATVKKMSDYISNMNVVIRDLHDTLENYIKANPLKPSVRIFSSYIDGVSAENQLVVTLTKTSVYNLSDIRITLKVCNDNAFGSNSYVKYCDLTEDVIRMSASELSGYVDINNISGNIYIKVEAEATGASIQGDTTMVNLSYMLFGRVTLNGATDYDKIVLDVTNAPQPGVLYLYDSNKNAVAHQDIQAITGTRAYSFENLALGEYYYRMNVNDNYSDYYSVSTKQYNGSAFLVAGGSVVPASELTSIPEADLETYLDTYGD